MIAKQEELEDLLTQLPKDKQIQILLLPTQFDFMSIKSSSSLLERTLPNLKIFEQHFLTEDVTIKENFDQLGLEKHKYSMVTFQNLNQLKDFSCPVEHVEKLLVYLPWLCEVRSQLEPEAFQKTLESIDSSLSTVFPTGSILVIDEPISESFYSSLILNSFELNVF